VTAPSSGESRKLQLIGEGSDEEITAEPDRRSSAMHPSLTIRNARSRAEREMLQLALGQAGSNLSKAAKLLGPRRRRPPGQGSPPAPAPTPPHPVRPKPRSGGASAPVEVTEEWPPDAVLRRTVSPGKTRDFGGQRRLATRRWG